MEGNAAEQSEPRCIQTPEAQDIPTVIGDLIDFIQRRHSPFTSSRLFLPGVGSAFIHRLAILCTPENNAQWRQIFSRLLSIYPNHAGDVRSAKP